MAVLRAASFNVFAIVAIIYALSAIALPLAQAQSSAPAPAPTPTSDGTTIDQGIACVLMLLALVLTYIIH